MYDYGKPEEYPKWLVEDIQDVIEDIKDSYPTSYYRNPEVLKELAKDIGWDAQAKYEEAIRLETKAEIIEGIANDWEEGYDWINKN